MDHGALRINKYRLECQDRGGNTNNQHAFISTVWFVQDVKKPQRYQVTMIGWQSLPRPTQVGAIGFVVSDPSCPAVKLMAIDHTLALDQSELSIVSV